MKFSEQMALIGKGFNKKDLEEFKRLEAEELAEKKAAEESQKETSKDDTADEGSQEDEIDYKKLYENQKLEIEQLKKDISEIQDKNIHDDMGPASEEAIKKEQDALTDMVRSFM